MEIFMEVMRNIRIRIRTQFGQAPGRIYDKGHDKFPGNLSGSLLVVHPISASPWEITTMVGLQVELGLNLKEVLSL